MVMLAVARARLGFPDAQGWLHREVAVRKRPNGTLPMAPLVPYNRFNDNGHYTEQFGVVMAVSELMLQSVADSICVFPALSETSVASFTNLRAQGGFLVSARKDDSNVEHIEVKSTVGGTLRLLAPWPDPLAQIGNGSWASVTPDEQGVVTIDTQPGDTLVFRSKRSE